MFKRLRQGADAFIIAEVGQNHQGDVDLAVKYIRKFADLGADAVKFQTRNNEYLFDEGAFNQLYNSPTSFGDTYGEHRKKLELPTDAIPLLKEACLECGVKFMSTPFDEPSLDLLVKNNVDILKVASFDLGNLSFLDKFNQKKIPTVLSVGGGNAEQILCSIQAMPDIDLAVLHCVSEYPCEANRLGLSSIPELIDTFPECTIGLSDHYAGILSGTVGYMLGARVFEKHVTFNRAWKGTDHSFALEPKGFENFVRYIRTAPKMLQTKPRNEVGEEPVFKKLGKSLVLNNDLAAGSCISIENLTGKIFEQPGIPVRETNNVIGRKTVKYLKANHKLTYEDIS